MKKLLFLREAEFGKKYLNWTGMHIIIPRSHLPGDTVVVSTYGKNDFYTEMNIIGSYPVIEDDEEVKKMDIESKKELKKEESKKEESKKEQENTDELAEILNLLDKEK
jgi:cbb3-type cytochrome oxidase cytochrome c subunit